MQAEGFQPAAVGTRQKNFEVGSVSWGRSSVGRALEWHSRGQGFDSPRLHLVENEPCDNVRRGVFPFSAVSVLSNPTRIVRVARALAAYYVTREVSRPYPTWQSEHVMVFQPSDEMPQTNVWMWIK
jgi:hypothetical protein